jgi:hypothetical protein
MVELEVIDLKIGLGDLNSCYRFHHVLVSSYS